MGDLLLFPESCKQLAKVGEEVPIELPDIPLYEFIQQLYCEEIEIIIKQIEQGDISQEEFNILQKSSRYITQYMDEIIHLSGLGRMILKNQLIKERVKKASEEIIEHDE